MTELYTDKVTQKKRAISLDIARGSMLFLIILAHMPLLLYTSEPGVITKVAGQTPLDQVLNILMELIVDNRARPLFAILFGYGLVMVHRKQWVRNGSEKVKHLIKRRCWYLVWLGAILAGLAGGQDILMTYGITGLIVIHSLKKDTKKIKKYTIISTIPYIILLPILWGGLLVSMQSYGLPVELTGQETYLSTLSDRLFAIIFTPFITHVLFPVIPSVLMGIWMGKLNLLVEPQNYINLLKKLTVICFAISLVGALPLVLINDVWFPSFFIAGVIAGIHILTGFAGGLGYAALFGLLGLSINYHGVIVKAITAMGKRSLTFFVLHEILIVIILSPIAFNLGAVLTVTTSVLLGIVMWAVTLSVAYFMDHRQIEGPLEKYMRNLTYKKIL
ncbi:DUF418 domain-containing protein [Halobacillus sp. H74]|uniref:DUF418 domain-containing protein n=1 Tax=Halobacillus sp. H74 TaxID=3457436 RepID=UPI003FCE7B35